MKKKTTTILLKVLLFIMLSFVNVFCMVGLLIVILTILSEISTSMANICGFAIVIFFGMRVNKDIDQIFFKEKTK